MQKPTKEDLQRIISHHAGEGAGLEQFKNLPAVQKDFAETNNIVATLKRFATDPPQGQPPEEVEVKGFYLSSVERTTWNKEKRKREVVGHSPKVAVADGEGTFSFTRRSDRERIFTPTTTLYDLDDDVKADPLTPIVIGPVRKVYDIIADRITLTATKETTIKEQDHDGIPPQQDLSDYVDVAMTPDLRDSDYARGTIRGSTNYRSPVYVTLTATDNPDEVRIREKGDYGADEDLAVVTFYDSEGQGANIKVPLQSIQDTFGAPPGIDNVEVVRYIANEPVVAQGQFGITHPVDVEGHDSEGDIMASILNLQKNQLMKKIGESERGEEMLALNLKGVQDKDGNPVTFVTDVGPFDRVYDIMQREGPDGTLSWQLTVLAADRNSAPWFSVKEENGGFLVWLNHRGEGVKLRDDDPWVEVARELGIVEEDE